MTLDITVPTLGESITEATVMRWHKGPGDAVALDETLVELETDKVAVEVKAEAAGTLAEIAAGEGVDVEVGSLLGRLETGAGAAPDIATAVESGPDSSSARETVPARDPSTALHPRARRFPLARLRACRRPRRPYGVCSTSTSLIRRKSKGPARRAPLEE